MLHFASRSLGSARRYCSLVKHVLPVKASSLATYTSNACSRTSMADLLHSVVSKPPIVFYHYPCPDGVFAALAANLYYRSREVQPRYVPFEVYRQLDPAELQLQADAVAFLLDYAGPDGFPQQLAQHVSDVIVLDHHKTSAQRLADTTSHPPNLHVQLDMQRSGAAIARDFFNPPGISSEVQHMFRMVEDADLWRWSLPDSQAFHAGLAGLKLEYSALANPDIFDQLLALNPQQVIAGGHVVLQRQEQLIQKALSGAQRYQLGGAEGLTRGWGSCMGCRVQGEIIKYRSTLGNRLAQKSAELGLSPVGLIAYVEADMPDQGTQIKVSLRSINDFDTSAISEAFGGGGHAAASSSVVSVQELDSWQAMAK